MIGPVTFERQPSGRIEIRFGDIAVGIIEPWAGDLKALRGEGADLQCWLNDKCRLVKPQQSRSINNAKLNMMIQICEWLDRAGPHFADVARAARTQLDELRKQWQPQPAEVSE